MRAEKIAALRASLARPGLVEVSTRIPLGHGAVDLCLKGGLARGVLHEIFTAIGDETAATGFAAALARRLDMGKHLLWIRQDFSALEHGELSATGLLELGLDPQPRPGAARGRCGERVARRGRCAHLRGARRGSDRDSRARRRSSIS